MKDISKKKFRIRTINESETIFNLNKNFCICLLDDIKNINVIKLNNKEKKIMLYKKSLYNYLLAGKIIESVKVLIKKHSYIFYELENIINNENVVIIKYKNYLFYNNCKILNKVNNIENYININYNMKIKFLFFYCLFLF